MKLAQSTDRKNADHMHIMVVLTIPASTNLTQANSTLATAILAAEESIDEVLEKVLTPNIAGEKVEQELNNQPLVYQVLRCLNDKVELKVSRRRHVHDNALKRDRRWILVTFELLMLMFLLGVASIFNIGRRTVYGTSGHTGIFWTRDGSIIHR